MGNAGNPAVTPPANQYPGYVPGTPGSGHIVYDSNGNPHVVNDGSSGGAAPTGTNWSSILKGAGGLLGGLGGYLSATQNNANAGKVDLTTTNSPWSPSDPYRQAEMQYALGLLGQGPVSSVMGAPGSAPPAGSSTDAARGAIIPGRAGASAGGGGPKAPGYGGTTADTQASITALLDRAKAGNSLYAPANQFVSGLLQGQDNNAYRQGAYANYQNLAQGEAADPALQRYEDMLFAGQMPGSTGPAQSGYGPLYGASSGVSGGAYGAGGAPVTGPVNSASYIKDILGGKYLNQGNPFQQQMDDAATKEIQRTFAQQTLPGINAQYAGSGLFGSTLYQDQLQRSTGEYSKSLADTVGNLNYQNYNSRMEDLMQALGYGTTLDTTAMNNAAQLRAAGISAGASTANVNAQIQSQQALARMQALQGAIGQGIDLRNTGAGGMGAIGNDFGGNQVAAMGAVPAISGLDIRDYQAAGDLSLGSQNSQNQYKVGMGQVGVGMANAGVARGQLNLAREQFAAQQQAYQTQLPWQQLGQYGNLINSASQGYGTSNQYGTDYRANPFQSVAGQTASGALGGFFTGGDLAGMFGGGGSSGGGGFDPAWSGL